MKVVILAGGRGTRLWPLSKETFPKQFLKLFLNESLLQNTVLRFQKNPSCSEILIVTIKQYEPLVKAQLKEISLDIPVHILIEPCGRNTAPAILLAMKYIEEKLQTTPDTMILVSPSDHYLSGGAELETAILALRSHTDSIGLFGVVPDRPETGYGYIETGSSFKTGIDDVLSFVEKPDLVMAKKMIRSGKFLWNSGMFLFSCGAFFAELEKQQKEMYSLSKKGFESLKEVYKTLPNISIDYLLIEKAKKLRVYKLDSFWSDIGSWDSIYNVMEKDSEMNVKKGKVLTVNTEGSLIFSKEKPISVLGMKDVLVIETEDAIFVGKRGKLQRMRQLSQILERSAEKSLTQKQ